MKKSSSTVFNFVLVHRDYLSRRINMHSQQNNIKKIIFVSIYFNKKLNNKFLM